MHFDPSVVPVSLLLVKLSVQSIIWCTVAVGSGSVAFVLLVLYFAVLYVLVSYFNKTQDNEASKYAPFYFYAKDGHATSNHFKYLNATFMNIVFF